MCNVLILTKVDRFIRLFCYRVQQFIVLWKGISLRNSRMLSRRIVFISCLISVSLITMLELRRPAIISCQNLSMVPRLDRLTTLLSHAYVFNEPTEFLGLSHQSEFMIGELLNELNNDQLNKLLCNCIKHTYDV
jgi:hypothetical protein